MPDDEQLADVLSEFARTLLTEYPIQAILDRLVSRIVDILPVSSAGVTLITPGAEPRYVAATDSAALEYEQLQTDLHEGPCVLAHVTGTIVEIPNLKDETRFPNFVAAALAVGLGAVFTFPLRHGDRRLGALDLYREIPGALSERTLTAAQKLADVVTAYLLNAQFKQDLQDASDRSRQDALHDPLTGLPNRVLMLERIEHAFLRSRRSKKSTAVIFVDLDRFKFVNDSFGHVVGDEMLVAVARRLGSMLRPADTLARLAGDEFVVICEDLESPDQATTIVARLVSGLANPFVLSAHEITMTASMGVAYAEYSDQIDYTPAELIHEADIAMYESKREGGRRQVVQTHSRLTGLQFDLPGALGRGELYLEYQPILAVADRKVAAFEAVLRWKHPVRGLVPPTVFIPLAEKAGLIDDIGQWTLQQAWDDRHSWRRPDLGVTVDVSAHQLMSAGFAALVQDVLSMTDDRPDLLTLEITESVFIRDGERARVVLGELRSLGVRLALDDFGTGYSSLNHLREYPLDVIKIDRSFTAQLEHDPSTHAVVEAVVHLAHDLGIGVVADGVETARQEEKMTEIGVDYGQGSHFGPPGPAAHVNAILGPDVDAIIAPDVDATIGSDLQGPPGRPLDPTLGRHPRPRARRGQSGPPASSSVLRRVPDEGLATEMSSTVSDLPHDVFLYSNDDSLGRRVVGRFRKALAAQAKVVIIATAQHRAAFRDTLPPQMVIEAEESGRFLAVDAVDALSSCMVGGRPDQQSVNQLMGTMIRDGSAQNQGVIVYSEMAERLWNTGDVQAALELERLVGDLQRRTSFDLLCAFPMNEVRYGRDLFDLANLHTAIHRLGRPEAFGAG